MNHDDCLISLLPRYIGFWKMKEASEPLKRVRHYKPLNRGGGYPDVAKCFWDEQRLSPDLITDMILCDKGILLNFDRNKLIE
jgi:hypothetical protein